MVNCFLFDEDKTGRGLLPTVLPPSLGAGVLLPANDEAGLLPIFGAGFLVFRTGLLAGLEPPFLNKLFVSSLPFEPDELHFG